MTSWGDLKRSLKGPSKGHSEGVSGPSVDRGEVSTSGTPGLFPPVYRSLVSDPVSGSGHLRVQAPGSNPRLVRTPCAKTSGSS